MIQHDELLIDKTEILERLKAEVSSLAGSLAGLTADRAMKSIRDDHTLRSELIE